MSKRRKTLLAAACLVAVAALVAILARDSQPKYEGHPLVEWVMILGGPARENGPHGVPTWSEGRDAADAIRHIGTNALPLLVSWIEHERSPWRDKTADFVRKLSGAKRANPIANWIQRTKSEERANAVSATFKIIGPAAAPAIPDLVRRASDPTKPDTVERCLVVLSYLGTNALPPLLALMQATNYPYRFLAAESLGSMRPRSAAASAVPLLVQSLTDTDTNLAAYVAGALGSLALQPELVAPALANALQNSNQPLRFFSALALWKFGTQAQVALPAVTRALTDPDYEVRMEATNAFHALSPHLNTE